MKNSTKKVTTSFGPFSLDDLIKKGFNKKSTTNGTKYSGVYVWGIKRSGVYFPLYVGKDDNIWERVFQHIIRFTGGEYPIPEIATMTNPNRNIKSLKGAYKKTNKLSNGLLYYPSGGFDFYSFRSSKKIQRAVRFFLDNFFVCGQSVLPYQSKKASLVESALAHQIGTEKLIGTNYALSHKGNANLVPKGIFPHFQ